MLELNKIYNEDCLEGMKKIDDHSIDLILCDLPYNTTACKWDCAIDLDKLWEQYNRIISKNGSVVLFASGTFTLKLMMSNPDDYKYRWVWVKNNSTNFVHAKNRPMCKHEDILVFSKAPMGHVSQLGDRRMTYNPQGLIPSGKTIKAGKGRFGTVAGTRPSHKEEFVREFTNYPSDVLLDFKEPNAKDKLHTSQKPTDLLEYLIKTYTNDGGVVLDNCMGSGSTAIAAINTGRNYIGFELNENYYNIATERINKTVQND